MIHGNSRSPSPAVPPCDIYNRRRINNFRIGLAVFPHPSCNNNCMSRNMDVNSQMELRHHGSGREDIVAKKQNINERTPELMENTATIFGSPQFPLKMRPDDHKK
jgi:hypothetical protein